jgi:hypothetical protein
MRKSSHLCLPLFLFAGLASAQVVAPSQLNDPDMRKLQQSSMTQLNTAAQNLSGYHFDHPFYFSRKLDVDEKKQQGGDQHSIRFERFNGATVVAISGNYYAAYPSAKFNGQLRARQTFLSVVLPILRGVVPAFQANPMVRGYAVEVSHHVLDKAMGMPVEHAENLMVYLPQSAAIQLLAAPDKLTQQAALLSAQVFLNANPIYLWLTDDAAPPNPPVAPEANISTSLSTSAPPPSETDTPDAPIAASAPVRSVPPQSAPQSTALTATPSMRDVSPQALAALQASVQGISSRMLAELEPQAQFVAYAPPAIIAFRHQAYLELSVNTTLAEPADTSRYKLAALAFDEHLSPLLRRVLNYFPGDQNFDGISFSTTVHTSIRPGVATAQPLSVEYFFPLTALRRYAAFDCTGQQLIDAGTVLINGERAGITLQLAE